MKSIAVITTSRADYGIYVPVLRAIQAADLDLRLLVAGMHLSHEFGLTKGVIEADGFPIAAEIEMILSSDTAQGVSKSIGLGVLGFAQEFARCRPDLVLALGDRYEMFAAVAATVPFNIPVAHLHGGEVTEGAIDNVMRHAITKMSHLHFVATEAYRKRVIQMGEEPWRVTVSGAPGLDILPTMHFMSRQELGSQLGIGLESDPLLVTFHPVTMEPGSAAAQAEELLAALAGIGDPIIFTSPNADAEGRAILAAIREFVLRRPNARLIANLGSQRYFSLMKHASAMVGNSSSGIIEAASFGLPVVNVGNRQGGRMHGRNVIDVPCERAAIAKAISRATSQAFRESTAGMRNPYGDGEAAERIVRVLKTVELGQRLITKPFYDGPIEA